MYVYATLLLATAIGGHQAHAETPTPPDMVPPPNWTVIGDRVAIALLVPEGRGALEVTALVTAKGPDGPYTWAQEWTSLSPETAEVLVLELDTCPFSPGAQVSLVAAIEILDSTGAIVEAHRQIGTTDAVFEIGQLRSSPPSLPTVWHVRTSTGSLEREDIEVEMTGGSVRIELNAAQPHADSEAFDDF